MQYSRVTALISKEAIRHNFENIKKLVPDGVKIMPVIKADGYGHGAQPLAAYMEKKEYVSGFATASVEEALLLRRYGIKKPILVLGFTFHEGYETMINEDIRTAVFTEKMVNEMSTHAQALGKEMVVNFIWFPPDWWGRCKQGLRALG